MKWLLLCGFPVLTVFSQSSTWQPVTNDYWGDSTNWTGGIIPGAPTHPNVTAIFPSPVPTLGSDVLLRNGAMPFDPALSNITIQDSYTISSYMTSFISAPPAGTLNINLSPTTTTPIAPVINANMSFDSTQALVISTSNNSNSSLELAGTVNLTSSSLTQTGSGALIITGSVQSESSTLAALTLDIVGTNIQVQNSGQINCSNSYTNGNATLNVDNSILSISHSGAVSCSTGPYTSMSTTSMAITNSTVAMEDTGTITVTGTTDIGNSSLQISNSTFNITAGTISNNFTGSAGNMASVTVDGSTLNIGTSTISCSNPGYGGSGSSSGGAASLTIQNSTLSSLNLSVNTVNVESFSAGNGTASTTLDNVVFNLNAGNITSNNNASAAGNATVTIQNGTYLTIDSGSITATNTNMGGNATLDIDTATLNIGSASINCTNTTVAGGEAQISIDNSSLTIGSGSQGISLTNSTMGPSQPGLSITGNSTLNFGSGSISCMSTSSSLGTFQNTIDHSTLTFGSEAGGIGISTSANNACNVELGVTYSTLTFQTAVSGAGGGIYLTNGNGNSNSLTCNIGNSTISINSGDIICSYGGDNSLMPNSAALSIYDCPSLTIQSGGISCSDTSDGSGGSTLTISNCPMLTMNAGDIVSYSSGMDGPCGASLGISGSTLNVVGNLSCSTANNGNGGLIMLSIDQSNLNIGGSVSCSQIGGAPATVSLDIQSSTLTSQNISCLNQGTSSAANLTINGSTVSTTSGSISNQGNATGSILIQNGSSVTVKGGMQNLSGNIALSGNSVTGSKSSVTTSGTVSASTTYSQDALSTLQINILSNSDYGLLKANDVSLDGKLVVNFAPSTNLQTGTIPVVISQNPITGVVSQSLKHVPNYLTAQFVNSNNEIEVQINTGPTISNTGVVHAFVATENSQRLQRQMNLVHNRLRQQLPSSELASLSEGSSSHIAQDDTISLASSDEESLIAQQRPSEQLVERMAELPNKPFSVYLGPIGSIGHVNTKKGQLGNSFGSVGALGGFDYAWTSESCFPVDIGIGTSGSYSTTWSHVKENAGHFQIDFVHGDVYAVFVPQGLSNLSINAAVGGGYEWVDMNRHVTTASLTAKGKTKGPEFDGLVGLEYMVTDDAFCCCPKGFRWTLPVFYVQYAHTSLQSFTEHGAGMFDLHVNHQKWSALWSFLGTRVSHLFRPSDNVKIRPEISLGWQRQWNDVNQGLTFSTFASPFPQTFASKVYGPNRDSFIFGFDLNCRFYDTMFIELDYDLIKNDLYLDNAFYLQFEYMF